MSDRMTTSIDKIRGRVARVREEHPKRDRGDEWTGWCDGCGDESWPCPTLRLAEKMLKLAEIIEEMLAGCLKVPAPHENCNCWDCRAERILAECAEEKGESDLPAGYTRVDPADGFGG